MTCLGCGTPIEQPKGRGRRRLRCVPCAGERNRQYMRDWMAQERLAHPERVRKREAEWYAANRKNNPAWQRQNKRQAKAWRKQNAERVKQYRKQYVMTRRLESRAAP